MEDKEFLIKKVEILESAIKQIAVIQYELDKNCLLYTSPSPRD